ncbi:protoporphyrinogen oxidase [Jimgerdemannia flammicorona]|uniref:Protoporphyrinogen oxidase n=1 Tax=Jimgerdemannia flammicorona TaxID=994334 RepID=A0A433Q3R0_9FUNG|nr:protoporphyrinogen oxidase [Jimgerdemannia flammicorona]
MLSHSIFFESHKSSYHPNPTRTTPPMPVSHQIAVLGGGISGLSAAYYLSQNVPATTKIVLFEGSKRVGGWIESKRVGTCGPEKGKPGNEGVLFELGPRSLRPKGAGGVVALDLIRNLSLTDSLLTVPATAPSARNRYIYYHDKINVLPSSGPSLLLSRPPIMRGVISSAISEAFRKPKDYATDPDGDESVYAFAERRFGAHVARNLVGSLVHGIYAGDARELSLRSTLRALYDNERVYGSVVRGVVKGGVEIETFREKGVMWRSRREDTDFFSAMENMSVIGFREGMEALPRRLREVLETIENVEVRTEEEVTFVKMGQEGEDIKVETEKGAIHASHVISALPAPTLHKLLSASNQPLPHLNHNPYVDVAVVNLAYDNPKLVPYDGFGFLTPLTTDDHPPANKTTPPGTLGVVFDSNAMPGQEPAGQYTKLTVMLGGHQWDEAFDGTPIGAVVPDEVLWRAMDVVKATLGVESPPLYALTNLHANCIPQYRVGHHTRLRELHAALQSPVYKHRLSVVGNSYLGVSVPDCIKNARALVEELVAAGGLSEEKARCVTGLNRVEVEGGEEGIGGEAGPGELKDSVRVKKGQLGVVMNG